jgi:hypothetical protein
MTRITKVIVVGIKEACVVDNAPAVYSKKAGFESQKRYRLALKAFHDFLQVLKVNVGIL